MSWSRFFVSLDMGAKNTDRALDELENDIATDKVGKPTEERADKTMDRIEGIRQDLRQIEKAVGRR